VPWVAGGWVLGMMAALDESVDKILSALRSKGDAFWNNTVVFFVSDNGGPTNGGKASCNLPLRGSKTTLFEGGVRVVGFVTSPLLEKPGRVERGLMHVTDITATALGTHQAGPQGGHRVVPCRQWMLIAASCAGRAQAWRAPSCRRSWGARPWTGWTNGP
jgi:arylsulfatase A-like enzyme